MRCGQTGLRRLAAHRYRVGWWVERARCDDGADECAADGVGDSVGDVVWGVVGMMV